MRFVHDPKRGSTERGLAPPPPSGSPPDGAELVVEARQLFWDRTLAGTVGGGNVPQRDIPRLAELYRAGEPRRALTPRPHGTEGTRFL